MFLYNEVYPPLIPEDTVKIVRLNTISGENPRATKKHFCDERWMNWARSPENPQ